MLKYLDKFGKDMCIGIDIGSTTAMVVAIAGGDVVYEKYERHLSQVRQKTLELLRDAQQHVQMDRVRVAVSGSAGLGMAQAANLTFVQ